MKTYEVELQRTSYVIVIVEANSEAEAEDKAWEHLQTNMVNINDAQWDVQSIEEVEQ